MNKYKAEILGLLASDGTIREYLSYYKGFDKRRGKTYNRRQFCRIIEFINTNLKLIYNIIFLLDKCYEYKPNIGVDKRTGVYRLPITKGKIIDDIKQDINLGKKRWNVPIKVLNGSSNIKKAFIRGFFDGDGSTDITKYGTPRIRISSCNLKGLKNLSKLLVEFTIQHSFLGPYKRKRKRKRKLRMPMYEINVKKASVNKFIKTIGSNHSKKQKIFNKILCRGNLLDMPG